MIVKVPDAIDEAQSGTCFCSIAGRQGMQDVQTGRLVLYGTVQQIPTCPAFLGPPYRCFVVRCMFGRQRDTGSDRPTDLSSQGCQTSRVPDRCGQGSDRKSSPSPTDATPRTGAVWCTSVEPSSFSPCPPRRSQAWPGELGESIARHRELELVLANGGLGGSWR